MDVVYVIAESVDYPPCKIGRSTLGGLTQRLIQLQVGFPYELSVFGYEETSSGQSLESLVHNYFKNARLKGEWFEVSARDALRITQELNKPETFNNQNAVSATDLGHIIKMKRNQLHLTQLELANKASVSRKWVVDLEKGKSTTETGMIFRILEVLNIKMWLS